MKKILTLTLVLFATYAVFSQEPKGDQPGPNEKIVAKAGITLPPDPPPAKSEKGATVKQNKQDKQATPTPQQFGHQAVLTWTAPTTCTDGSPCTATSYNVYKVATACPSGTTVTGATKIASVPSTTTTYTDTNLVAPNSYCWYVTATNATGESTASNAAGGTLTQPLLAAPSNFVVTAQ
jgi:hypothetical protein